jgi:hypothetical protein
MHVAFDCDCHLVLNASVLVRIALKVCFDLLMKRATASVVTSCRRFCSEPCSSTWATRIARSSLTAQISLRQDLPRASLTDPDIECP